MIPEPSSSREGTTTDLSNGADLIRVARVALASLLLTSAWSCGDGTRASLLKASSEVARAAGAVTGQDTPMADAATGHPGFDTGAYPGDDAMQAWRTSGAPYEWAGYYLPSPCHPDDGWSGKRERLTTMGYGLAVIYVGQQTWGRTPGLPHFVPVTYTRHVKKRVGVGRRRHTVTRTITRTVLRLAPAPAPTATCNADFVSAARGAREGMDAVTRAEREGFAHGTTIFLDLERMDRLHQSMRDYYMAWVRAVLADKRYVPGIYVHTHNADVVHDDVKRAYQDAGVAAEPPFWVAKSRGFDLTKLPTEVGHAFAAVWQGVLDVQQTWNGHRIPIDVNVAATHSPSAATTPQPGQQIPTEVR